MIHLKRSPVRRLVRRLVIATCMAMALAEASLSPALSAGVAADHSTTVHKSIDVDGLKIYYREAGPNLAPTILLLHGFPSSSRMFETLIPLLADRYHIVAPDYPGFGHSDAPPPDEFDYTFDNIAHVMNRLTEVLGLHRYALYVADYGGPVGFRLAIAHPERIAALIIQNAVAHDDGLDDKLWAPRRAFWADRATYAVRVRQGLISPDATRARHIGNSPHPERYSPDLWEDELAFLNRPGMAQIQLELFYDYRTNVAAYPIWQAYLRENRPPVLVTWGKYDPNFSVREVEALSRDVPDAEVHIVDGGHFALDEAVDEIAALIHGFLSKVLAQ
ncbi:MULTISPECIES: alpha/beta fold hydrolase [unclassified Bradyrhizobium]|uniref:alpha/beta fold hydrolase n=1 Tax=unclassified Bradyrhizobium TaxID=2631580 RepID=UPI002011110E|nr:MULTISPECIES: alpha/beta hydrolase [unclassified Bradyrhizobium]